MMPGIEALYDVMEVTWPAKRCFEQGPFQLRDGAGGGKRVSAATARGAATGEALQQAEAAMAELNQTPLFMIREGEAALDALLAAQGYEVIDPVNIYCAPVEALVSEPIPPVTTFTIWEPLSMMCDIWLAGGIGPARVEVMRRADVPKTGLFGRHANRPAATGYVGLHDGIAMVHALEIHADHRCAGLGKHMMRQAALWARDQGATHMSAVCTKANVGANALYPSLGMSVVGSYHYRIKKDA